MLHGFFSISWFSSKKKFSTKTFLQISIVLETPSSGQWPCDRSVFWTLVASWWTSCAFEGYKYIHDVCIFHSHLQPLQVEMRRCQYSYSWIYFVVTVAQVCCKLRGLKHCETRFNKCSQWRTGSEFSTSHGELKGPYCLLIRKDSNVFLQKGALFQQNDVAQVRDAGEGERGGQAPLLPFAKRGEGGKSALFMKSYDHFDN